MTTERFNDLSHRLAALKVQADRLAVDMRQSGRRASAALLADFGSAVVRAERLEWEAHQAAEGRGAVCLTA